jgi:hypothetical protein
MKRIKSFRVIHIFLFAVIVSFLFSATFVNSDSPHIFSLTITSPAGGTVTNPVKVSGTVSSTGFIGQLSAYHVRINWGDTTFSDLNQTSFHLNLTESAGDFTGTYSTGNDLAHVYVPGSYTITALLCHQACTGAEGADATATVDVTIVNTCTLSIGNSTLNFGTLNPGDISADNVTTVTNTGTIATTSFSIYGIDWSDGPSHTMPVNQTHWDNVGASYASMNNLLLSPGTTLANLAASASQIFHFKVQILAHQFPATYSQTITYTAGC